MLAPTVDPRSFQDLVDEAKRRIPQYCPEWTDHNVSDRLDRLARRHEPLDTRVFQGRPEPGDAFLLGFAESVAGHALRLSLDVEDLGATGINQDDPPLVWEFWRRDGWKPLAPGPEAVGLLHRFDVHPA